MRNADDYRTEAASLRVEAERLTEQYAAQLELDRAQAEYGRVKDAIDNDRHPDQDRIDRIQMEQFNEQ